MQGMAIEAIPYDGADFAFPLQGIQEALNTSHGTESPQGVLGAASSSQPAARPRILLICNPNNPTGTRLAPEPILELAAAAPQTLVVIDELYEAFTGDSVLPLVDFAATPNLVVLRSLAKTAGLAGLRMGFAIGAAPVIDRISRVTGPYDINSVAVTAAHAALADQAYTDAFVAEVKAARAWLVQQLEAAGVRYHCGGGNYLLIWPARPAASVEAELRAAGILVRSMAGKPLIDGALRVSIGTCQQMQRFWNAYMALAA